MLTEAKEGKRQGSLSVGRPCCEQSNAANSSWLKKQLISLIAAREGGRK